MVRRTPDDIINQLADRYAITIKWVTDGNIPDNLGGPMGHGCDPVNNLVYIDESVIDEYSVEVPLHELVHVITQPPFWTIKQTPEEFLLFQYERCLARSVLEKDDYKLATNWQEQTYTSVKDVEDTELVLGAIKNYEKSAWWRRGFALCRRIGLLDYYNRPTWKRADWSSFTDIEIHRLKNYYGSLRGLSKYPY